jgi:hypothetical protein
MSSYTDSESLFGTTECESSEKDKRPTTHYLERFAVFLYVVVLFAHAALFYTVKMADCPLEKNGIDDINFYPSTVLAALCVGLAFWVNRLAGLENRINRYCKYGAHCAHVLLNAVMLMFLLMFTMSHGSNVVPFVGIVTLCAAMYILQIGLQLFLTTKYPEISRHLSRTLYLHR